MTKEEFKAIRMSLGMSRMRFASLLGYKGSCRNKYLQIRKIEAGDKEISPATAVKVLHLRESGGERLQPTVLKVTPQ